MGDKSWLLVLYLHAVFAHRRNLVHLKAREGVCRKKPKARQARYKRIERIAQIFPLRTELHKSHLVTCKPQEWGSAGLQAEHLMVAVSRIHR